MTETQTPTATIENGSGNCLCGCGQIVGKMGKSFYKPGHDARHAGQVARLVAETGDDSAIASHLPTEALQRKAENMVLRLRVKAQEKSDRDAAKAAGKPAKVAAVWEADGTVKIGRWVYEAQKDQFGNRRRNENTKGTGAWVAL
jgi:hypothetical protein